MANKKARNEQRKNNDTTPPARREAKSSNPSGHVTPQSRGTKLSDDNRVIHAEEPNRDDG